MNRQQAMTALLAAGIIFLVFYWTHSAFNSSIESSVSSLKAVEAKADKASALAAQARQSKTTGAMMRSGLLSFLQTTAEKSGLGSKVGGIKPKSVPGSAEAATIRLEGLNYNETIGFLKNVEKYSNLYTDNVKISKRYDNEKLLNLVMEIIKK